MTKIVIVAGGLATRMLPITEEIPKCMVDINGTPLIEHQLGFFKRHGYTDIIFCVAHLAAKVKAYFGDGSKWGLHIQYVQETEQLMGTAGSVKLVEPLIGDEDFIVYYGDNLTSIDFGKLLAYHTQQRATATMVMRPNPPGYKGSSVITLNPDKSIKVFLEKPPIEEIERYANEERFINNGIYVLSKQVFAMIPMNQKCDFAKDVFPKLMEGSFFGYPTEEFFFEVGRIEKYEKFKEMVKGKTDIFDGK
jgi:mannose-1-phosphate guanylyltransferase / phosphomannomutase